MTEHAQPGSSGSSPSHNSELDAAWARYEVAKLAAEGKPTLSPEADERRQALRDLQRLQCLAGYHEDPDKSGMCIRCSAVLDEDEEDR